MDHAHRDAELGEGVLLVACTAQNPCRMVRRERTKDALRSMPREAQTAVREVPAGLIQIGEGSRLVVCCERELREVRQRRRFQMRRDAGQRVESFKRLFRAGDVTQDQLGTTCSQQREGRPLRLRELVRHGLRVRQLVAT